MGLEPTISCLGSKRSTTELHPLGDNGVDYTLVGKGMSSLMKIGVRRKSSRLLGSVMLAAILDMPCASGSKNIAFIQRSRITDKQFFTLLILH